MNNLKFIKDLKQEAYHLQACYPGFTAASNLMNQAAKKIENLRELYDDPQWDATDAAHPAWWRGEKYSAYKVAELIANILSGKDTGEGVMNEPLETMRRSVMKLKVDRDYFKNKKNKLQERNNNQAQTIHSYRTGKEIEKLLRHHILDKYNLEKENEHCWERVHDLEEENARYWEEIGEIETEKDYALEQRQTDWERIHNLEKEVDNLKREIFILHDTIKRLKTKLKDRKVNG